MMVMRDWASRHPRPLMAVYRLMRRLFLGLAPLWWLIGNRRLERPLAFLERALKGPLFDCRMCGTCVLSETGMTCPMNCPKALRNGPCGGVRSDGHCETKPEMRCVWVVASEGSRLLGEPSPLALVLPPVNHARSGKSSWLSLLEEAQRERAA
ncbi:MAG: methylenetetrahydrofolate reductase C-terminal domain-containing protein [Alphaproteobacteria bacterium]|nr:methylenetetrahydrofolate reductase C-terminal domain-containing protein [Alphaproteobacteria bacterium]MDP7538925.1 methylenetetrahydrofolate reductase C-terminal domain-containing protein [Alphaproteobacteria bacterium]